MKSKSVQKSDTCLIQNSNCLKMMTKKGIWSWVLYFESKRLYARSHQVCRSGSIRGKVKWRQWSQWWTELNRVWPAANGEKSKVIWEQRPKLWAIEKNIRFAFSLRIDLFPLDWKCTLNAQSYVSLQQSIILEKFVSLNWLRQMQTLIALL